MDTPRCEFCDLLIEGKPVYKLGQACFCGQRCLLDAQDEMLVAKIEAAEQYYLYGR